MSYICAMAVCVMLLSLSNSRKTTIEQFTPPPFETAALPGVPEVPQNLGWSEIDADVFHVGICGKVSVADYEASVWLTNPEGNSVWLKLRVLDEYGNILGETGLLTPGHYVQTVSLCTVPATDFSIVLKVMAYEPETYRSVGSISLNTSIC